MPRTTSSASAMPGTFFGFTKDTICRCFNPVSDSASISSTFRAVGIDPDSIWKPSRGPSSLMLTDFGKSDMSWSSDRFDDQTGGGCGEQRGRARQHQGVTRKSDEKE